MKRGTPDHPKMARLARALNISRRDAIGLMELLWHWAARYCPQGDIGKWSNEDIAEAVDWNGDPTALLAGLSRSGWINNSRRHRFVIHDWHDHCDEAVKKFLAYHKLDFLSLSRHSPEFSRETPRKSPLPGELPEPEPEPEKSRPGGFVKVEADVSPSSAEKPKTNGAGAPPPLGPLFESRKTTLPSVPSRGFGDWTRLFVGPIEDSAEREFKRCVSTPELLEAILDNTLSWMETKKYGDGFNTATHFIRSGVWKRPPKMTPQSMGYGESKIFRALRMNSLKRGG